MKTLRVPFALLLLNSAFVFGQAPVTAPGAAEAAPAAALRTPQELEQLLAPIALYPDALIAIILPAATVPTDIVLAARHVRENPDDRSQIEHRAWDESVKSLTNYPDVLKWMDENLQWTKQVGEAFAAQPADVMQTIQKLRAQARAAGTLVDTPQQQIIAEPEVIRIVPAQPDVIYVPYYEPEVVFVDRPAFYPRPFLSFGIGVPVGSWLAFECDWRRHAIWVGDRHRHWTRPDWRRPIVPYGPTYSGPRFTRTPEVRQWRPPPRVSRTVVNVNVDVGRGTPPPVVRPTPFNSGRTQHYGYAPRPAIADARAASPQPVAPAPSPARTTSWSSHRYGTNPSSSPAAAPAPTATLPATSTFAPSIVSTQTTLAPAPTTAAPPVQRRSGTVWSSRERSSDDRPRGFSSARSSGNNIAPAPAAVVTAPAPQPSMPAHTRTYTRPSAQPSVVYSPNVAASAPPVHQHRGPAAAPAQAAPAPSPQPAASAPAPAPPSNSNANTSGGHRGGGGRRNVQEN